MKDKDLSFESGNETLHATLYGDLSSTSDMGVVLCPPHPLYGGNRNDIRIVKVARELSKHNIRALCLDYGNYSEGLGEVQHVLDAISFMQGRGARYLGLLGYSFGSVVASNAASTTGIDGFVAMSILRGVNSLTTKLDFGCPKLFVHGRRDASYSDFEHLFTEAKGVKQKLVLDTDHFYMNHYPAVINIAAETIRRFFEECLKKR